MTAALGSIDDCLIAPLLREKPRLAPSDTSSFYSHLLERELHGLENDMISEGVKVEVASPQSDTVVCIHIRCAQKVEIETRRVSDFELHQRKSKPKRENRPLTAWELD